jgi:hypothetical protein
MILSIKDKVTVSVLPFTHRDVVEEGGHTKEIEIRPRMLPLLPIGGIKFTYYLSLVFGHSYSK